MLDSASTWADYQRRCNENSDIAGQLPYLYERALNAQVILELGVRGGNSTAALLAAVVQNGGHVWSIDCVAPQVPGDWTTDDRWTFFQYDDLDPELVNERTPQVLDLLFIDTSHRYRHTLAELDAYGPRVRSGGVILLHDVDLEIAPESAEEEDRGFPVRRATQEWCQARSLTPAWREGWSGLGVIEVT